MKPVIIAIALSAFSFAHAKDLGVQGTVWPIIEEDMRKLLLESAAKADWSAVQDEVKDSAKNFLDRLPAREIPVTKSAKTVWMDPSIQTTSDVQAPVKQADGTYRWVVVVPKGTKVNPLAKQRPVTAILLFDGADEEQRAMVKAVLRLEPDRIIPMEAGAGKLNKTNEYLGRPVFHANDGVIGRFSIQNLPSLVYPGSGPRSLHIGVTSFSAPYVAKDVVSTWPDLLKPNNRKN